MDYCISCKNKRMLKANFQPGRTSRVLMSLFLACCFIVAFALGCLPIYPQHTSHAGDDPGLKRLEKEIARLAKGAQGVVGVGAIHIETGREVYLNKSAEFPMASTFKVPVAAKIFSLIEEGKVRLEDMISVEAGDLRLGSGTLSNLFDDPGVKLSVLTLFIIRFGFFDIDCGDDCAGVVRKRNNPSIVQRSTNSTGFIISNRPRRQNSPDSQ